MEPISNRRNRIIFCIGGGIILQLNAWAHLYGGNYSQCAGDLVEWLKNHDTSDWNSHEVDIFEFDPSDEDIRNDDYKIVEIGDSIKSITANLTGSGQGHDAQCHLRSHLINIQNKLNAESESTEPINKNDYVTKPCCPSCGSDHIEGSSVNVKAGSAYQEIMCWKCGSTWTDVYKLVGYIGFQKCS